MIRTSGKQQGVWLWSLVVSTLWLWGLGALPFFKQLIFTFSVFDIEAKVFDHLHVLLGLSSEVVVFLLRQTLLGLSSEMLNVITFQCEAYILEITESCSYCNRSDVRGTERGECDNAPLTTVFVSTLVCLFLAKCEIDESALAILG